ncbi:MAG: D-alanyl-D-alanine carboxypeptidase/D-alanyl-D-alanine-endopeptidase [Silicimonas sp.]|nr:D-alanyl-D-alanine carboxypeptidase/D-alanyl-D-alanine-endopeptidase [Silicimonas sp.]
MTRMLPLTHRRTFLTGALASAGTMALGDGLSADHRPRPRPAKPVPLSPTDRLIKTAKLGGAVGFAVMDMDTGEMLDSRLPGEALPPASTLKAVTALYALDRLGPDHRFGTRLLGTGPVVNGRLEGDLILAGGGDPTLDTDRMADLARALREEAEVESIAGRFLLWSGALPTGKRIGSDQPDHVAYNPSFGGLNLNFNRVHFQWEKSQGDYDITMHARGRNFSPATQVAQMAIIDRKSPVFAYRDYGRRDQWSVAKWALGKDGARWLPVRYPALYCGDVFRTLARSKGIRLPAGEAISALPEAQPLVQVESDALVPIARGMLKYSTNLTAETLGLAASQKLGAVDDLPASGARMGSWAMANFGVTGARFRDHSGLGYGSAISARDMARILGARGELAPLLKRVNLSIDKARPDLKGVEVRAKTGTLNFVSSLAGYVSGTRGRSLAFAILTADTARRDAIPPAERERPPGAKSWSRRSRRLQKELLRHWATRLG